MSTTATLDQQIDYMERQVKHQRKRLPLEVEAGHISEEKASHILACACASLQTLTQLRGIARKGETA